MTPAHTDLRFEVRRYGIERLELARLNCTERRHIQRSSEQIGRTVERWARRQWRHKPSGAWAKVGAPQVALYQHPDLWIQGRFELVIEQRALRRDEDWNATMGESEIDTDAAVVEIAVRRGEWPQPPPESWADDVCDCDCCYHAFAAAASSVQSPSKSRPGADGSPGGVS